MDRILMIHGGEGEMMNLLLNKEMPVVCGDKLSQFVGEAEPWLFY